MNSHYQVYKCIYNGESPSYPNGRASTVEPTGNSTTIIESSADGYRWKYMYTITISDYIKFVSSDFIPVKNDSAVNSAAVDGAIEQLLIDNRGSGNDSGTYYCPIIGDGNTAAIARVVVPPTGSNANKIDVVDLESGSVSNGVTLRRVYHTQPPAIIRYFDPFVGTGLGSQQMLNTFGWGAYSPGVSFMMQPMFDDLLRLQAIEFNDYIRKSSFGFHVDGQRVKLFPVPQYSDNGQKVYFEYTLESETKSPIAKSSVVSDLSNAPFGRLTYNNINSAGKQWIARYALALAKEMLGAIRAKFSSIPIPGADVTLDGSDLRSEASAEKETLLTELKDMLESTSRRALMEAKKEESEFLEETLNRVPRPIYIG